MSQKITRLLIVWKEALVSVLVAIVCVALFRFFPANGAIQDFTRLFFFFGLIPSLFIVFILKKSLNYFGFSFPNDRASIVRFISLLFVSLGLAYVLINFTPLKSSYALPEYTVSSFGWFLLYELLFINVWFFFYEFFFKGFLLFTFADRIGLSSVLLSAVLFALFLFYAQGFSWQNTPILMLSLTGGLLAYKNRSFIHSYLMGLLVIISIDAYVIYAINQYL